MRLPRALLLALGRTWRPPMSATPQTSVGTSPWCPARTRSCCWGSAAVCCGSPVSGAAAGGIPVPTSAFRAGGAFTQPPCQPLKPCFTKLSSAPSAVHVRSADPCLPPACTACRPERQRQVHGCVYPGAPAARAGPLHSAAGWRQHSPRPEQGPGVQVGTLAVCDSNMGVLVATKCQLAPWSGWPSHFCSLFLTGLLALPVLPVNCLQR